MEYCHRVVGGSTPVSNPTTTEVSLEWCPNIINSPEGTCVNFLPFSLDGNPDWGEFSRNFIGNYYSHGVFTFYF